MDYLGKPGWDDNAATFELTIVVNTLHGDYQLANVYGHSKAKDTLKVTLRYFLTAIATDIFTRYIIVAKLEIFLPIFLYIRTF